MPQSRLFSLVDRLDLIGSTRFAVRASKYHFRKMKETLDEARNYEGPSAPEFQELTNTYYFHFRGFFWEMMASWDSLLQAVNQRLALGLPPRDVALKEILDGLRKRSDGGALVDVLTKAHGSEWFRQVREYRHFAHVGTVPATASSVSSDPPGGPKGPRRFMGLTVPGMGEPISACREYGKQMENFVKSALEKLEQIESAK